MNWTPARVNVPEAVAETVVVPETITAPLAGDVIETFTVGVPVPPDAGSDTVNPAMASSRQTL